MHTYTLKTFFEGDVVDKEGQIEIPLLIGWEECEMN